MNKIMNKKLVKWIALLTVAAFLLTSVVAIGFSIFEGQ